MRLVLLCSTGLTGFQQRVLATLFAEPRLEILACAIDSRPQAGTRAKLMRNLRQGRGGFVIVMAANTVLAKLRGGSGEAVATESFMAEHGVPAIAIDDPTDEHAVAEISSLAPDALVLIAGFGIVKEPLLSLAPQGVLSFHHGDMRSYRGMPPAFWELFNEEAEMGVTVQRLSPGVDDGAPIVEKSFAIGPRERLASLERRIFGGSVEMMREALLALAGGEAPTRLDSYGDVYTLPNLRQWLRFQAKMARRWLVRG
ncbi:MAG: formyltransferase family protein [Gaiellaceae bacterium]